MAFPNPDIKANEHCLNCQTLLLGPYCSGCGQRRARRLTFRRLVTEMFVGLSTVDSAFLRTTIDLTRQPGRTCRAYVNGQRQKYFNPLKYTLATATILILLFKGFNMGLSGASSPFESSTNLALFNFVWSLFGYLIFLILLPVAGIQRFLFRKHKFNFAECYIFGLFICGHLTWLHIIFGFADNYVGIPGVSLLFLELTVLIWSLFGFYESLRMSTAIKGILLYLGYLLFKTLVGGIAALIALRTGIIQ